MLQLTVSGVSGGHIIWERYMHMQPFKNRLQFIEDDRNKFTEGMIHDTTLSERSHQ